MQTRLAKYVRHGLLVSSLLFACSSGSLALAQDRYESDNTVGAASNIVVDVPQTNRTIHVTDDIDYASFSAVLKHAYGVGMTNIQLEIPETDVCAGVLTLYATNGTTVLNTDYNDTQIWISMLTTNAGAYYARAESSGAAGTGYYDLVVSDYGAGDAYEMDNSLGTASNIVAGVSQPRSLHWTGDTDYSKFTNTANHIYLIAATNYTVSSFSITLYDTDGTNALASEDSGVFGGDASFEYLFVSTGTYYLAVSPMGASTGTYDLAISDLGELPGDAYEPDNSVAAASNITVGVIQSNRSIHWSGDVDYAAVPVTTAHRYVITATNVGADLDIAVSLYGTNGTTLLDSTDIGGYGENEFLTNVCTITGVNFIKLESYDGTGVYSLVVTDIGSVPADSHEVDDSVGQAALITPGAPQTNHTIHLTSDVDYLHFTAQAERYYTIETCDLDWGLDTYIYLYDSTGTNLLASDNDSGSGSASWLEYKMQSAGTYYIKVSANNAASVGYYSIRLTDTRVREKSWKTRSSLGALSSPAIGHDGLIYVGSYDSNLYAFAAGGTTSKAWRAGSSIASSPAIASNGSVYIGSHDDRFYSFNTNGGTNWISGTTFNDIIGSPALSFDGRIYIGSVGFRFLSFNPEGTTNWTIVNVPGGIRVSPAIGTNGTVYIGCDGSNFYSFSPNGTTNWVARLPSAIRSSAAIASNGDIYVACYSGNLYAFNPANGATNHVWATGKNIDGSAPVIGTNGDIYIGAYSGATTGALYSFNPDGATNWFVQLTNAIVSSPLIGYDGTIYIGTRDGYFYAFNPDGTTNFMTTLSSDDITSSPVIDTNGLLYVAADNRLFAIYGTSYGTGGLADSPWPMFLHDARHTGSLPPPAPTGVSASDGSFTNQVQLTWSVTTNTVSYDVYRSTTNNSATAVRVSAVVSNQYDDTSTVPATAYYYWVKAVNHSGNSQLSASDAGWRMISSPGGVTASDGIYTSMVQVAWNSASGAVSYVVWRNTTSDTPSASNLAEVAGANYSDTAAVTNLTYYYWIQSRGANGTNSAFSLPDTGWRAAPVIAGTPPSAPTGVTASDGDYTNKVALSWNAAADATGYNIFRHTSNNSASADQIGTATSTTYDDAGAVAGTTYYYWVKATNAAGASAFSASDSGWRRAVFTITATAGANGSITPSGAVPVLQGANQSFTILPSAGYYISSLQADGVVVTAASTYIFENVNANHSLTAAFVANRPPQLVLTATPQSGVAPLRVLFNFTGSTDPDGSIAKYDVDRTGDGIFEVQSAASGVFYVEYASAGTYQSVARVTDDGNATSTTSVTIQIHGVSPAAVIAAQPASGTAPLTVNFTGTNSTAPSGRQLVAYEWDFDGDGVYDRLTRNGLATWTYREAGTNLATLRITDDAGMKAESSALVVVAPSPFPPPVVTLSANPEAGYLPLTVSFTAQLADGQVSTNYYWDFDGDGQYDTRTATGWCSNTYTVAGTYQARVLAMNTNGLTGLGVVTVRVNQATTLNAWISTPKDNSRVSGTEVSLRGHAAPANLVASAQFQYKPAASNDWINLGDPIYPPPHSYPLTWDVSGLPRTDYQVRVAVTDTEGAIVYSDVIRVTVATSAHLAASSQPQPGDIDEGIEDGKHYKTETFSQDSSATLIVYDGTTVLVRMGTVDSNITINVILTGLNTNPINGAAFGLTCIQKNRQVSIEGNPELQKAVVIIIPYLDDDNDGIVDGTRVKVSTLMMLWFDPETGTWKRCLDTEVYPDEKYVKGTTYQLAEFGLFGGVRESPIYGDFDGDRKADQAIYQMTTGLWRVVLSGYGYQEIQLTLGGADFLAVPADYDGDQKTDPAVYREKDGYWFGYLSRRGYAPCETSLGGSGYLFMPSDYDGDGNADPAVYQETSGVWAARLSGSSYQTVMTALGGTGYSAVPGDYDGDDRTDLAVYQEGSGLWNVMLSGSGYALLTTGFGGLGWSPIPADYDGDGRTDPALYNASSGQWAILMSNSGYGQTSFMLGGPGYYPVPGDYDGAGTISPAVYHEITGEWQVLLSGSDYAPVITTFGGQDFTPVNACR